MSELGATVARFSPGERWAHRATGLLMGTCLLTAFVLYYGPISLAIGHRHTVELIHVWAGYALPGPLLLGLASSAYRADVRVLNASLTAGSIFVLVGTGTLMFWTGLVRLPWRTGATFVHDWFALGLGLLVLGHIWFAISDPEAREGMRTGRVRRSWARKEHPAWEAEGP